MAVARVRALARHEQPDLVVVVKRAHAHARDLGNLADRLHRASTVEPHPACESIPLCAMDVEQAITDRRTHKAFAPDPLPRELIDELLELARWAPNHHLTNPWRFRVLGLESLV